MLPCDCIFSPATMRLHHLVERGNSVSLLELDDILAYFVDDSRDVVSLVSVVATGEPFCGLLVS